MNSRREMLRRVLESELSEYVIPRLVVVDMDLRHSIQAMSVSAGDDLDDGGELD